MIDLVDPVRTGSDPMMGDMVHALSNGVVALNDPDHHGCEPTRDEAF